MIARNYRAEIIDPRETLIMKGLSIDIRERVIKALNRGASHKDVAAKYEISKTTTKRIMRYYREHGTVIKARDGHSNKGRKPALDIQLVEHLIATYPTASVARICLIYESRKQTKAYKSTMWRTIVKLKKQQKS